MAEAVDDAVVTDPPAPDAALEAEARELGWAPKDKWRGEPSQWIDAKSFVEKGRLIIPIMRKRHDETQAELAQLRQRDVQREAELRALNAALKAVEESQSQDLQDRVQETKEDLEDQIAAAAEAGDHKRLAKLTSSLAEVIAAEKVATQAPVKEEEPAARREMPASPEFLEWSGANPWLGKDQEKTQMAEGLGRAIAAGGKHVGKAFFVELDKRLEKYYGTEAPASGKVESGRQSGEPAGSQETGGTSYSDLPKEAKEACESLSRKMVGEGKRHKDAKSWRASYAKVYFAEEARNASR